MWTVFVFAFLTFLSALGFKGATARRRPVPRQPVTPSSVPQQPGEQPPAPFIPSAADAPPCEWPSGSPYLGFLPPTIKQRIRAEAHGATPTSRRISRGSAEVSQTDPFHAPEIAAIPAARHGTRPLCPVQQT